MVVNDKTISDTHNCCAEIIIKKFSQWYLIKHYFDDKYETVADFYIPVIFCPYCGKKLKTEDVLPS